MTLNFYKYLGDNLRILEVVVYKHDHKFSRNSSLIWQISKISSFKTRNPYLIKTKTVIKANLWSFIIKTDKLLREISKPEQNNHLSLSTSRCNKILLNAHRPKGLIYKSLYNPNNNFSFSVSKLDWFCQIDYMINISSYEQRQGDLHINR